ncbi:MAG: DUF86 domain-containing protein [Nitrospirae bacterium]|nr:DUF86 domain-containing protein [Nitrospirota bacterium]
MTNKEKKYLSDMNTAIEKLYIHLKGINSEDDYIKNITVKSAVERELEIIGEAMNNLLSITPDISITSPRRIISMRNRLIHGYDGIDDRLVLQVVKDHIPILKSEIEKLIEGD